MTEQAYTKFVIKNKDDNHSLWMESFGHSLHKHVEGPCLINSKGGYHNMSEEDINKFHTFLLEDTHQGMPNWNKARLYQHALINSPDGYDSIDLINLVE